MAATTSDITTLTPDVITEYVLPVYGLPGYRFYVLHVCCILSLVTSIGFSSGVLIYLRPTRGFYGRPIGDRLVVYLAVCDLFFSLSLLVDQFYMISQLNHIPDDACAVIGFFINVSFIGQTLVVFFAAANAFASVGFQRKIQTGRGDWKLLVYVLVGPSAFGLLLACTGYFGPSGAWCYINRTKPLSAMIYNLFSIMLLITFVFCIVCYAGVWIKIRQVARQQTGNTKYQRTAKVMMLFVVAYMLQWWGAVVFGIWAMIEEPAFVMTATTICCNSLGGLHNFFAYTFIRKRYTAVSAANNAHSATSGRTMVTTIAK